MSKEDGEKDKKDKKEWGMDNGRSEDRQRRETIKNKTGKGMRRGMKALKEIKESEGSHFRGWLGRSPRTLGQIYSLKYGHHGPPGSGRGFSGGIA